MKLLISYIAPYKWLIALALLLASINQVFSLFDPLIFGKLFDDFITHPRAIGHFDSAKKFVETAPRSESDFIWGVAGYLGMLIGVAMISRIAKAFQDYFGSVVVQKFGAKLFTEGLKKSMKLAIPGF